MYICLIPILKKATIHGIVFNDKKSDIKDDVVVVMNRLCRHQVQPCTCLLNVNMYLLPTAQFYNADLLSCQQNALSSVHWSLKVLFVYVQIGGDVRVSGLSVSWEELLLL